MRIAGNRTFITYEYDRPSIILLYFTVMVLVTLTPLIVAVIFTLPFFTPFTTPLALTVATPGLELNPVYPQRRGV